MDVYDKGLITILAVSLLMIVVALPLALCRIPRNAIYGFRTCTTMASDEVWYSANAFFARALIWGSVLGALVACGVYLSRPISAEQFLQFSILIMVLPGLAATVATLYFIRS